MRMWMIHPRFLCTKHLIAEHCECHMTDGAIRHGKNMAGFYEKRILFPRRLKMRHASLVLEMLDREYEHHSPDISAHHIGPYVNQGDVTNNMTELARRCPECKKRMEVG